MPTFHSLFMGGIISLFPTAVSYWLFGQVTAVILFTIIFLMATAYVHYSANRKPDETLDIYFEKDKNQLLFLFDNDLISSIDSSQFPSMKEAILHEFNNKKSTILEIVGKVRLINIDDRDLETQLNKQLAVN
jgi:hypothetical protein